MSRIIRGNQVDPKLLKEAAFEEGRTVGITEGRAEAGALLLRAQHELSLQKKNSSENAAQLAIELASAILGDLARQPSAAAFVAERAWRASGASAATLRVHPDDVQAVSEALGPACTVVADASLKRGDCIVDTHWGRLDARLETQLAKFSEALSENS
jgi:flagellar biosynthesis/type III secretory pathway protein FliH